MELYGTEKMYQASETHTVLVSRMHSLLVRSVHVIC